MNMKRTKIAELLRTEPIGTEVLVKGWVKAFRNNQFIALNDGSTPHNLQVVVDFEQFDAATLERIRFGAAIGAGGTVVESQGKGQKIEIKASALTIYGDCNPEEFPLQPKKQTLEFCVNTPTCVSGRIRLRLFSAFAMRSRTRSTSFSTTGVFITCTRRSLQPATQKAREKCFR
jgi:aspartyl/asparaginyl-tRNA synthetase